MSGEINRIIRPKALGISTGVKKKNTDADPVVQDPQEQFTSSRSVNETGSPGSVNTVQSTQVSSDSPSLATESAAKPDSPAVQSSNTGGFQVFGPDGKPLAITVGADGSIQVKDPDLLAQLAEQASRTKLDDPGFVNPLATVNPKDMGPLGDILGVSPAETKETLAIRQPDIHKWAVNHKAFKTELDFLTLERGEDGKVVQGENGKPKQREIPVEALRAYEERWTADSPSAESQAILSKWMPEGSKLKELSPEDKVLKPDQMTRLLTTYKDRGHFEDVSRFYEAARTKTPSLGKYEIPREHYIVSLNKQKKIKESIQESEALINERVEEVTHGPMGFIEASRRNLYRSLGINGEVLSGLGKAYKVVHQQAEKQIDEKVANADMTSLYSQLTGTDVNDWKLGEQTVGEAATAASNKRFEERFKAITARTDKPLKAGSDMLDWIEKATGVKSSEWTSQADQSLYQTLKKTEPSKLTSSIEELTGKKRESWSIREEAVRDLSAAPINKMVGKLIRGTVKKEELTELVREMSGKELQGALANVAQQAKLDELTESVTKRGSLDPELVKRVEHNSSSPVSQNLLKASRKALEVSRDYYTAGFGVDVEYYPGINVVYNELALGNHKTAAGLIPIVQYAVMREGGATSKDYWNLATQMELGAIGDQPKTVHDLLPRLLDSAKAGWELGSTADNLEDLAEKRTDDGQDASLISFVASTFRERIKVGFPAPDDFKVDDFVKEAQSKLAKSHDVGEIGLPLTPEEQERKKITDRILSKSKNFQEVFTSKFVGGSWKFVSRGGVSDRPINRQTIRALREVNKHLGLDELKGPEDFPLFHSRTVNYIDNKFALRDKSTGERPMEDLGSEIHHKRDRFTQSRHDVFHSRTSGTAQTNLAVEIMLGQSDCRDTDATYQVMFDLWKRDQQTSALQGAIDAVLDGHESNLELNMGKAKDWDKTQVVSMDLAFHAPAKLELDEKGQPIKYAIQKDAKGRMVRTDDGDLLRWDDGSAVALEDHSMPFKLQLDDKGLVLPKEQGGMRAVDPFYQHFWQLGNLEVDPKGILDEDKGFALGQAGVMASDNKSVELFGKPTRYSGAPAQDIEGEAGQVTMGGLEVAMNDLSPLLSENNELKGLTDAITGMVTGTAKERVLNAVMSRMLDESAQETHQIWKRSKDRELMNPDSPFLGSGPEKVVVGKEQKQLSKEEFKAWLQVQAPEGAEVPQWKMKALYDAPEGSVVFDPAYKTYGELVESGEAERRKGEAAVAPLALSLYLQDFRHTEDLSYTLDNILSGKDQKGKEELEKVNRVAYLASQLVMGERSFDNKVAVMENSTEVKTTQARRDFASWHTLHAEDEELAELDAYTLKPAADWLLKKLDTAKTNDGLAVLDKVVGDLVESAASDAHNLGWKASKDRALASNDDPFVGWASVRNRISSKTPEVADMNSEEIAGFYKLPLEQVSETKAEAIREATRKAISEGTEKGSDITHTLFKPYEEMLADQPDGGIRGSGANAAPLMTLSLYLSDFRSAETETVDGLKTVLAGLLTGTDSEGLKDVTMLNHVAFQAAQLPYGERSFERVIPVQENSGQTRTVPANPQMASFSSVGDGTAIDNAQKVQASVQWLNRDLDELVEQ